MKEQLPKLSCPIDFQVLLGWHHIYIFILLFNVFSHYTLSILYFLQQCSLGPACSVGDGPGILQRNHGPLLVHLGLLAAAEVAQQPPTLSTLAACLPAMTPLCFQSGSVMASSIRAGMHAPALAGVSHACPHLGRHRGNLWHAVT